MLRKLGRLENGLLSEEQRAEVDASSWVELMASFRTVKGTSMFRGVSWAASMQKWRAVIKNSRRNINLGHFTNEEAAARSYDRAAHYLHGRWVGSQRNRGENKTGLGLHMMMPVSEVGSFTIRQA